MTYNSNFFVVVRNITNLLYWPIVFGLQQGLRSRQPATVRFEGMYFNPSKALIGRIERSRHMSPLLRSGSIMDLINSVCYKGLESSLLVGDVLKDCHGVRPKGDTINKLVQLIVNEHVETRRDHSCL